VGALTVYLACRLAQRLWEEWFAVALAGCCSLPPVAHLNFLFQPNSFEVLAFTACLYWLVAYWHTERPRYLYYIGVGVSLLNKYTTFFCVVAVVLIAHERQQALAKWVGVSK